LDHCTARAAALAQGVPILSLFGRSGRALVRHHQAGELFGALVRETDELLESRENADQAID